MARFSEETIHEVIARNDIVEVVGTYVTLTQRGDNNFGLCPFHNEKSPSFSVSQSKQIFYCFGCGVGGNVLSFVRKIENLDFLDGLKLLAARANFHLPQKEESQSAKAERAIRENSAAINKEAALFYYNYLHGDSPEAVKTRQYLHERGVTPSLVKRFGIGLSPNAWDGLMKALPHTTVDALAQAGLATQSRKDVTKYYDRFRYRLMFPIIDARNRVVGFGGRIMEENPEIKEAKYVNTPETALFHKSDNLYGLNIARKARKTELIIVEGYMDVVAMHKWGFANTVGVLGTALNDAHTRLLKSAGCKSVVLMLDGDNAGIRATLRAIPPLTKAGIKVKTLNVNHHDPSAKDPDEYLQKNGATKLAQLLNQAKSHIAFQVALFRENHDLATTEGRVGFTQEAAKLLATLPSPIEIDAYVAEIAKESDISPNAIHLEINRQKTPTPAVPAPRRITQNVPQGKGVKKAKAVLMHMVLTSHKAALALEQSGYITQEELEQDIYHQLLNLSYANARANRLMSVADIISAFEDESAQRMITEIFMDCPEYENNAAIEKALNETAYIIKREWALKKMQTETKNPEILQNLGQTIRKMPEIRL